MKKSSSKFKGRFWWLAVTWLVGSVFLIVDKVKPLPDAEFVQQLPQDNAIKVYFNHNFSNSYTDPYRGFVREGDNLEAQIINAIAQAKVSVEVAVMEFRLPKVAEAMVAARNRGVKVRLQIDNKYNQTIAEIDNPANLATMNAHDKSAIAELRRYPADALAMVKAAGIEVRDDAFGGGKGSGLMHEKFVVVDDNYTIISSGNFTISDMHGKLDIGKKESRGNPNNMLVIPNNPQLAKVFVDEFNYMFERRVFKANKPYRKLPILQVGSGTITVNFSPARKKDNINNNSNGLIAAQINKAQKSIHLALFAFSAQSISDELKKVHESRSVEVKELIDPDFYSQPYSKSYDAMGVCPTAAKPGKRQLKNKVQPWSKPVTTVGFPTAKLGDRGVHSKMGIIDGHIVITGSHNWSNSGNYSNDEVLAIVDNPIVAAHYEREHKRLYATAVVGLKSLPNAKSCAVSVKTTPTETRVEVNEQEPETERVSE